MTYHARTRGDGTIGHPSQTKAWEHVDDVYPNFASDIKNVRLGLCTDGFDPLSDSGKAYSMWPVFMIIYNLPLDMCMKEAYIFMLLLIPGLRSPGRKIYVFL